MCDIEFIVRDGLVKIGFENFFVFLSEFCC